MLLCSGLQEVEIYISSPDAVVPVAAAGHQAPPREHSKAVHRQQIRGKGRSKGPAVGAPHMSRHKLVPETAAFHAAPADPQQYRRCKGAAQCASMCLLSTTNLPARGCNTLPNGCAGPHTAPAERGHMEFNL